MSDARGEVLSTWWEFTKGWQPWFAIGAASAKVKPGQPVTAVWSNRNHLDLFVADQEGRVLSTWWEFTKAGSHGSRYTRRQAKPVPANL